MRIDFHVSFFRRGTEKLMKGLNAGSSTNVSIGLLKIHKKISVIFSNDLPVRYVVRLRFRCEIKRGRERKIF